jgi:hypothetical protein
MTAWGPDGKERGPSMAELIAIGYQEEATAQPSPPSGVPGRNRRSPRWSALVVMSKARASAKQPEVLLKVAP